MLKVAQTDTVRSALVRPIIFTVAFFIFSLVSSVVVFAQTNLPVQQSVWVTPADAKKGEAIEIKALIYNDSTKSATMAVLFADVENEIGTKSIVIEGQTAKTVIMPWLLPDTSKQITVSIVKALDVNKKNMPELLGIVGTVNVGIDEVSRTEVEGKLKGIFLSVFSKIDPWREKQSIYFTKLRDVTRERLGLKTIVDAYKTLAPQVPGSTAVSGENKEKTIGNVSVGYDQVPLGLYFTLIYATALASIFSSIALFYILSVLLLLFVLRFIIRIFL